MNKVSLQVIFVQYDLSEGLTRPNRYSSLETPSALAGVHSLQSTAHRHFRIVEDC